MNPILLTDSYKATHWKQYPPKTEVVYSYLESRGGLYQNTVFFGLQYILKKYLTQRITEGDIVEASNFFTSHLGDRKLFNEKGWRHILNEHAGLLPVSIKAVQEGTIHPVLTPLVTIENTDPECYWLTNYLETLLVQVWYPITVATLSYEIRNIILMYLEETGSPELINFKLHDFGFRGVSSVESAGIGGLAHLLNFRGTDTLAALVTAREYYHTGMAGFSIPAAEHSTITSWGKDHEVDAFRNMIMQFKDQPLYAVVSDSYNIFKACDELWGTVLKDDVLNAGGRLIVRPDSGDPVKVILRVLEILGERFGYIKNEKGYKVLNPSVRVIQGDGVDQYSILLILAEMQMKGWSADNIAFGMGGALLQKLNRDTQKFAFKCSSITVDGQEKDVFKDPITDKGKVSKVGRFKGLKEVFRNGMVLMPESLEDIRDRLHG